MIRSRAAAIAGERWLNLLFGASILCWAVLGLVSDAESGPVSLVRWVSSALHFSVAWLFFTRGPLRRGGSPGQIAASLPALLIAGWAASLSSPGNAWPATPQIVFAAGGTWAVVSLLCLGRSFAILPALREIVARGPYSIVRHPAYLGELTMALACGLAGGDLLAFLPFLVGIPLIVMRILAEESVLGTTGDYERYRDRVRWRLIPGLW